MNPHAVVAAATEFAQSFDASKDLELWEKLFKEEEAEVKEAFADLLKEVCDMLYIMGGVARLQGELGDTEKVTDGILAMKDFISVMEEIFTSTQIEEAFKRVHASNMSKLGDDGKPVRREDGKILKGPNYKPPVLIDLI